MILSLVICTIVYILLTLVLTGAVNYRNFEGIGDPLAFIFEKQNLDVGWMQFFVSIAAVIAMTSVLLVFQMGQPRIWMSMSRDGLMPPVFQKIHPTYKTPSFSTIVTGLVVGIPILFTDKTFVLDFTSIATLFAFVLVCGGVLLIPRKEKQAGKFHIPYINGQLIFPAIIIVGLIIVYFFNNQYFQQLFHLGLTTDEAKTAVAGIDTQKTDFVTNALENARLAKKTINIATIIFWITCLVIGVFAFIKKYSLIPLLGLVTCLYLLTGMTAKNWAWFSSWLVLGLVVYFLYGYKKSKLAEGN
jgi:amino acid transporter